MNNFFTGFFTLVAALGGVWLKDHLDNKKISKSTVKQRAIESYTLAGRLMHSLNSRMVICANLLKDKNYNYAEIDKSYPDTSSADLEKLELLIIENFYDLNVQLLVINKIILDQSRFLLNIMTNVPNQEFESKFISTNETYDSNIVGACAKLRYDLIEKYINKKDPHINIFNCMDSIKKWLKNFFSK
jgi:hypothetical protein